MSILSVGIGIADAVTKSLGFQGTITHQAWTGQDGHGASTYAAVVSHKAVIDLTRKHRPTGSGKMVTVIATITILERVADTTPLAGQTRYQPIDVRDIITLPDGTTGPILSGPSAVLDPDTNRGFFNSIELGDLRDQ